MFKGIRTVTELGERPEGQSAEQHIRAVHAAMEEHARRALLILQQAEETGRGSNLLADEQRDFDRHENESQLLANLLKRLEWGESTDWSQAIPAGTVDTRGTAPQNWAGHEPGYDRQARHTGRGLTYRPDADCSFLRDLKSFVATGDAEARGRLTRNNTEVATEYRQLSSIVTGQVAEFVPPMYLMDLLVRKARPGRVFADQITNLALPTGTMTAHLPRVVQGTSVDAQAGGENTQVTNQDMTSDDIAANVHTLAGQQILSWQLVDQSPIGMDEVILTDLAADLAVKTDVFVLSHNETGKVGVLNLPGTNTITFTSSTPTVADLYPKIANGIQQIATSRYMPATRIFMHPRRWAWFESAIDTTGRPLVVPAAQMPMNAMAEMGGQVAEGLAGSIMGLPVYTDANLPTNLGTDATEDPIIVCRAEDLFLWEGVPRIVPDRFSLSGQLSLRLVTWRYMAVQHGRYPSAVSIITGTGMAAPTF